MTYNPGSAGYPEPQVLTSMTDDLVNISQSGAAALSTIWNVAANAYFYPVYIKSRRTYTKAFWLNGATAAGNVDVGIYTVSGATATRVVASTAEAQAGVSAIQVATTFTSTTLAPGLYYLAMSCSLGTATVRATTTSAGALKLGGVYQVATAHPLPATATVTTMANALLPVFGFSELSTI